MADEKVYLCPTCDHATHDYCHVRGVSEAQTECGHYKPAPAPSGWGIDTSAGREILVYEGCSVIEDEQARQVLAAMTAKAPLPVEVDKAVVGLKVSVQNVVMGGWKQAMPDLDTLLRYLSDLTRRLADAEECLTIAHMDGYHKGQKAGQSEHNNSVRMGQYILEVQTEKRLRESAEARVRELENSGALNDEMLRHELAEERFARGLAEALVRKLEAENVELHEEVSRRVKAAARAEQHEDKAKARIAELEASKARVMAWARGRCECCGTDQGAEICFKCRHGYDLGEYPQAAQYADNWTPPQAWEVGE